MTGNENDRPDERKERMVSFTIGEEDLARLTNWCRYHGLQRARGIRTLIRFGLQHDAKPDDEPDLRTREQRERRRGDDASRPDPRPSGPRSRDRR